MTTLLLYTIVLQLFHRNFSVADLGLSALRSQRLLLTQMISALFKEILSRKILRLAAHGNHDDKECGVALARTDSKRLAAQGFAEPPGGAHRSRASRTQG